MLRRAVFASLVLAQLPLLAGAPSTTKRQPVVDLPKASVSRIPSPDGRWALVFECGNDCSERILWIDENTPHTRRLVKKFERTLSVSWAPDGRFFFVDDWYGSNGADCFVLDPTTLKGIDIASLLASGDSNATRFLKAGHSYLVAKRWIDSHQLFVALWGHFDDAPMRGFTLKNRVGLNGAVQKLSESPHERPQ
jgi:hypothetical protein